MARIGLRRGFDELHHLNTHRVLVLRHIADQATIGRPCRSAVRRHLELGQARPTDGYHAAGAFQLDYVHLGSARKAGLPRQMGSIEGDVLPVGRPHRAGFIAVRAVGQIEGVCPVSVNDVDIEIDTSGKRTETRRAYVSERLGLSTLL